MNFSIQQARSLVADLFKPNPFIYWTDFLASVFTGYALGGMVTWLGTLPQTAPLLLMRAICLVASALLLYRSALFIHELVHLPQKELGRFRVAWNLLFGIPCLVPSFVYYSHLDHHRRKSFGTQHDGEYLPLARHGWWPILHYLAMIPLIPLLGVVRFGLLTPLSWLHPTLRRWVHQRASSLVIDPSYMRPIPAPNVMRIIFWQELACFVVCVAIFLVFLLFARWPYPIVIQAYLTAVLVVGLNSIRTLGSHRWWNEGRELTFGEQLLDSVTVHRNPWISELWGPVGTRYHSLHHLFPSLPYHSLPEAHRRLVQGLPVNSAYHHTVEPSLSAALLQLFRRSVAPGRAAEFAPQSASRVA